MVVGGGRRWKLTVDICLERHVERCGKGIAAGCAARERGISMAAWIFEDEVYSLAIFLRVAWGGREYLEREKNINFPNSTADLLVQKVSVRKG